MADGPGKYNDECTALMRATRARAVVVVVVGGYKGNGHEAQFVKMKDEPPELVAEVMRTLAATFREVAELYEQDAARVLSGALKPESASLNGT